MNDKEYILTRFTAVLIGTVALFAFPPAVHAAVDIGMPFAADLGLPTIDIREILVTVIRTVLGFTGFILVLQILRGGFDYMLAGGSDIARDAAVATLKNAIIGVIIVTSASSATTFIVNAVTNAADAYL